MTLMRKHQADTDISMEMLYPIFEIWEKEEVPPDWKEGYLIKTPWKGDLSKSSNSQSTHISETSKPAFTKTGHKQIRLQHYASQQSNNWNGTSHPMSTLSIAERKMAREKSQETAPALHCVNQTGQPD